MFIFRDKIPQHNNIIMPVISLSFSQILDAASYQAILDNVSYHCTPQCGHVMSGAQSFRKVGQEYSLEGQRDKASETGTVPPNVGRLYYILRGTINLDEFLRGQNRFSMKSRGYDKHYNEFGRRGVIIQTSLLL